MIGVRNRLVLNSDVVIRAGDGIPGVPGAAEIKDEFIVTRTASRSPSLAVNRETAELLLAFSAPESLLNVVHLMAKRTGAAEEAILEEAYPVLGTLLDRGLLVRVGKARRDSGPRRIGMWALERRINDFDDSAVFLAKDDSGRFGALKLLREHAFASVLQREARVLELAGDDLVPTLLDSGMSQLGPYIVSEWKPGLVAGEAFREARQAADARVKLLRLASGLVEAFERLHTRGILHGDIQPKNALFDLQGRTWIIDFTNSHVQGLPGLSWRTGVPFFFEPEYAKALLAEPAGTQPLNVKGENYSIAALLFYLLTGTHSMEFSLDREALLRQIAEADPRPLLDPSGAPWEAVESALRPYLSKDPETRPTSLDALRDALEALLAEESRTTSMEVERPTVAIQTRPRPEHLMKDRYGLGSPRLRNFDLVAPRCSLNFGAAGIAYTMLRASQLCADAELLWAADAWITLAEQHSREPEAFTSREIPLTRQKIGYASLACAEPGVFYVKSLVRSAACDPSGVLQAVHQFAKAAERRPSHAADVNLGGVGLAVAADRLSGLPLPPAEQAKLRSLRDRLMASAWKAARPGLARRPRLGFAHGVAGVLFGALTTGESADTEDAISRLRCSPVLMKRGIRWPVIAGGGYFMPGWCNGVAGHLLTWTRLWQCSGCEEHREMMERIAWGIMESWISMGNVCCGGAGQAIALASFGAAVQEPIWQRRAMEWLDRLRPQWPKDDHPQSLFRGELGLLLARLECESGRARFPVWGASLDRTWAN